MEQARTPTTAAGLMALGVASYMAAPPALVGVYAADGGFAPAASITGRVTTAPRVLFLSPAVGC